MEQAPVRFRFCAPVGVGQDGTGRTPVVGRVLSLPLPLSPTPQARRKRVESVAAHPWLTGPRQQVGAPRAPTLSTKGGASFPISDRDRPSPGRARPQGHKGGPRIQDDEGRGPAPRRACRSSLSERQRVSSTQRPQARHQPPESPPIAQWPTAQGVSAPRCGPRHLPCNRDQPRPRVSSTQR
jgi:hypothetical protein